MAQGRKTGGRQKGTLNRTTQTLKEAILAAAEEVGSDGSGAEGLKGYLKTMAAQDRKAFATLLGRVLPMELKGENGGPVHVTFTTVYEEAPK